jgi:GNAT superfamily N-acetyltransferase
MTKLKLKFYPVTPSRWKDFEKLFGKNGACAGCWCMYWRWIKTTDAHRYKGAGNKKAIKKIITSGEVPGILAYENDNPIGWCSVAPKATFPYFNNSRLFKNLEKDGIWSVTCFFIAKEYQQKGISVELLKEAVKYVRKKKGKIVEGYPVEPKKDNIPPAFAWNGLSSAFIKAGFKEFARPSETRPVMRYNIK